MIPGAAGLYGLGLLALAVPAAGPVGLAFRGGRPPVDLLKIDRDFVDALDGTAEGAAVAQAVLRLARVLGLEAVADGVTTAVQARE